MTTPRDIPRIDNIIRRLFTARDRIPSVRWAIDDMIADQLDAQGSGKGSGISDPTGARAGLIGPLQDRHRRLNEAIRGIEKAVEHFACTAEACLSTPHADHVEQSTAHTCPVMELKRSSGVTETFRPDGSSRSERMVRCGALSAHKIDEHGNPIGYDPDGYCVRHRTEADAAKVQRAEMNLVRAVVNRR